MVALFRDTRFPTSRDFPLFDVTRCDNRETTIRVARASSSNRRLIARYQARAKCLSVSFLSCFFDLRPRNTASQCPTRNSSATRCTRLRLLTVRANASAIIVRWMSCEPSKLSTNYRDLISHKCLIADVCLTCYIIRLRVRICRGSYLNNN